VAGDLVARGDVPQRWLLLGAHLLRVRAAGTEPAIRPRIVWGGELAGEGGDEVGVEVLDVDLSKERISLSTEG
jgi:hypothetical protein